MKYNKIILDFDGVICDSNGFKADNILAAAKKFTSLEDAITFRDFFISKNGIPREIKINGYFQDKATAEGILNEYDRLNSNLVNAPLAEGVEDFLELNKQTEMIILSGGVRNEIELYLSRCSMSHYFSQVLCGPKTKEANLALLNLKGLNILYIGDSLHDYEIAQQFSLDFIFMYGYTQFYQWSTYNFSKNVLKFKNFTQLIRSTYGKN